jgi:Chromatin assembly factor 1 subunit A
MIKNFKPAPDHPTLAKDSREAFSRHFAHHVASRPSYTPSTGCHQLAEDMRRYKCLDIFKFAKERRRNIIIDDSMMKYLGFFEKRSMVLNPRNPMRKDESLIDYEMDSEEEWNEQNGEDVGGDNKGDEDEDDEVEAMLREEGDEEEAGFIVPDDYLSASELNLTQS